jgi:general secretion pathway protein J
MMRKGFTLVEVLVALLIMAVIAAMGWQGVAGMARSREVATAASERTLRLSAVVGQWEADLAALYDSPPALEMPGIAFDGASLRLLRRTDGGVQVVVWSLREGIWRRWASPATQRANELQQAWAASNQLQGPEVGQLKLLEGATGWQVYFWRGQGWTNAQSTGDLSATGNTSLPPPTPPASGASSPGNGASAPGGGASAPAAPAATQRSLLPTGVRLVIDLPEGSLTRDVQLSPQQP